MEDKKERLAEPEALDDYKETFYIPHNRCTYKFTAVEIICTRPVQAQDRKKKSSIPQLMWDFNGPPWRASLCLGRGVRGGLGVGWDHGRMRG